MYEDLKCLDLVQKNSFRRIVNLFAFLANADSIASASISGKILMDESWNPTMYLSFIPSMEDRSRMSADMIIGSTVIDEEGG